MSTVSTTKSTTKPVPPDYLLGLRVSLVMWLGYRVFCIPIIFVVFTQVQLNLGLGILNQALWLMPVWLSGYFLWQASKPYPLMLIHLVLLIYLAGSGLQLFYGGLVLLTYVIDFLLLLGVNGWLFLRVKKLPKMHEQSLT